MRFYTRAQFTVTKARRGGGAARAGKAQRTLCHLSRNATMLARALLYRRLPRFTAGGLACPRAASPAPAPAASAPPPAPPAAPPVAPPAATARLLLSRYACRRCRCRSLLLLLGFLRPVRRHLRRLCVGGGGRRAPCPFARCMPCNSTNVGLTCVALKGSAQLSRSQPLAILACRRVLCAGRVVLLEDLVLRLN